jgi:hypothetical protein
MFAHRLLGIGPPFSVPGLALLGGKYSGLSSGEIFVHGWNNA